MHILFKEAWMLRSVWVSRADVACNKQQRHDIRLKGKPIEALVRCHQVSC